MRKIFVILCFIALVVLSLNAFAYAANPKNGDIVVLSKNRSVFLNLDCEETQTCDLKAFAMNFEKYKIRVADSDVYGTTTGFEFETDSVESLEKYAIVQFMRGCEFDYYIAEDKKYFGYSLRHFGESALFCFPDWVIDSADTDPIYGSDPQFGRFANYRWNRIPGSVDRKTEVWYFYEKPVLPRIYVMESKLAFVSENSVKNVSLEFKMCIYKTKDVPTETTDSDLNFATPIHCFNWSASHVYNPATGEFETKSEIDPFCKEKPPPY